MALQDSQFRISHILPQFEVFRSELDEHHDRRERVVKASRDITAASKKIIFALQRVTTVGETVPPPIQATTKQHYEAIRKSFGSISRDLQGLNAHRYALNITSGMQECVEAVTFHHYLEHQKLLTYESAVARVNDVCATGDQYDLGCRDYLLGILDTSGELMRFAITAMAVSGQNGSDGGTTNSLISTDVQVDTPRSVLDDLRQLHLYLTNFDCGQDFHFKKEFQSKLAVMRTSVDKVEKAQYGLAVRGSERPRGWIPDIQESVSRSAIEVESH